MQRSEIEAHIFYRHSEGEIAELNRATISMREYILAVSTHGERQKMKRILSGEYFRSRDARAMVKMLTKAAKYSKAHLGDYFPVMRPQILDDSLALEQAATNYLVRFAELKNEVIPLN